MDTKLTLKLNNEVIERAKQYASNKKTSLSRLIENYLDSITRNPADDFEISPFVKSISSGRSIPIDIDERAEYNRILERKHR